MLDKDGRDVKVGAVVKIEMGDDQVEGEILSFLVATNMHPLEGGAPELAVVLTAENERIVVSPERIMMTDQRAPQKEGELSSVV